MALTKSDKIYIKIQIQEGVNILRTELETKIRDGIDILRVLIEDLSHKQDILIEGHGMIAKKLEGHDTQINNHEKRITTLEDFSFTKRNI